VINFEFPHRSDYKVRLTDEAGLELGVFICNGKHATWKPERTFKGIIIATIFDHEKWISTKKIVFP